MLSSHLIINVFTSKMMAVVCVKLSGSYLRSVVKVLLKILTFALADNFLMWANDLLF